MAQPPTKEQLDEWERRLWLDKGPSPEEFAAIFREARKAARLRALFNGNSLRDALMRAESAELRALAEVDDLRAEVARLREALTQSEYFKEETEIENNNLRAEVARLKGER